MNLHLNRRQFAALAAAPFVVEASDLQTRTILTGRTSLPKVGASLVSKDAYTPYPRASERSAWEGLPAEIRTAAVDAAAKNLKTKWAPLPVTLLLEYTRTGNRAVWDSPSQSWRNILTDLVTGECVEGKGRFMDDIASGIWALCEQTWWGSTAHLSLKAGGVNLPKQDETVVELFGAEAANLLAWTDYLLGPQLDGISKILRQRLRQEVSRRILTPALERDDFGWMGLKNPNPVNNWNPWICSNWLAATLLLETNPAKRDASVWKIMRCLDRFLSSYFDDGGCDEGPSYWGKAGSSLFDALHQLRAATGGAVDAFQDPLVKAVGDYIYKAHVANDFYVNFADAPALVHPPGELIYRTGTVMGDAKLASFGAFCEARVSSTGDQTLLRRLPALFNAARMANAPKAAPMDRDAYFPGVQVVAARKNGGSAKGLYFAAQGGHNAESHNHNDVGNFIVYAEGLPYIVDLGPETYTAKTFSSRRYEIWTMQSAFHNLPTVNGAMQSAGRQFQAANVSREAGDAMAKFELNIEQAWPKEAGLKSWRRSLQLDRGKNELGLTDKWAMTAPGKLEWTFMTPCKVKIAGPGEVVLERVEAGSPKLSLRFDAAGITAAVEAIPITDARLKGSWGGNINRVLLKMEQAPATGEFGVRVSQG